MPPCPNDAPHGTTAVEDGEEEEGGEEEEEGEREAGEGEEGGKATGVAGAKPVRYRRKRVRRAGGVICSNPALNPRSSTASPG